MSLFHQISPEDIDLLPYPAYYMDENRLIIRRNKNASPSRLAIIVRAKIDKYISVQDKKRVENLEIGQEIFVDLHFEPAYGAIICRIENGYIMAVRNITAHMMKYVGQVIQNLPTFFGSIPGQIESLRLATYQSREEMAKVRRQYYKVMRYHSALSYYFKNIAGRNKRTDVCEIASSMNGMLNDASTKLRPNGVHLSLDLKDEDIYVHAFADDLRYASASLLSIAAENTYDGRIHAESTIFENEYVFRIVFSPRVDEELFDGMVEGYYGGKMLESTHGNMFFDLLLVQMLAEKSGWDFTVASIGCSKSIISMSIYVPLAEKDLSMLNCPPDTSTLLETMLVNVLGPNYEDQETL